MKRTLGEETLIAYFNQGEQDLELALDSIPEIVIGHLTFSDNRLLSIKQNGFVVFKIN
nr:hypothetical protein [Carnobacterium mobile]